MSLLSLAGCQSHPPTEVAAWAATDESQQDATFVTNVQSVFYRNGLAGNEQGLKSVVDMRMTLGARNHVVDCSARSRPPHSPDDKRLVNWVTDLCWIGG